MEQQKRVAILQSNYIPWKGYFDIINSVDQFIIYDGCQYTTGDWRNRNKIKTPNGSQWLSIPINSKNHLGKAICEIDATDNLWRKKHFNSLKQYYAKTLYFKDYNDTFESMFLKRSTTKLSGINSEFIKLICKILEIETTITCTNEKKFGYDKNQRLIDILKANNASIYLSGPAAKAYIDAELFKKNEIELFWMDYSNYPEYKQLYPPFDHNVSILDLIFNHGKDASRYMKSFASDWQEELFSKSRVAN